MAVWSKRVNAQQYFNPPGEHLISMSECIVLSSDEDLDLRNVENIEKNTVKRTEGSCSEASLVQVTTDNIFEKDTEIAVHLSLLHKLKIDIEESDESEFEAAIAASMLPDKLAVAGHEASSAPGHCDRKPVKAATGSSECLKKQQSSSLHVKKDRSKLENVLLEADGARSATDCKYSSTRVSATPETSHPGTVQQKDRPEARKFPNDPTKRTSCHQSGLKSTCKGSSCPSSNRGSTSSNCNASHQKNTSCLETSKDRSQKTTYARGRSHSGSHKHKSLHSDRDKSHVQSSQQEGHKSSSQYSSGQSSGRSTKQRTPSSHSWHQETPSSRCALGDTKKVTSHSCSHAKAKPPVVLDGDAPWKAWRPSREACPVSSRKNSSDSQCSSVAFLSGRRESAESTESLWSDVPCEKQRGDQGGASGRLAKEHDGKKCDARKHEEMHKSQRNVADDKASAPKCGRSSRKHSPHERHKKHKHKHRSHDPKPRHTSSPHSKSRHTSSYHSSSHHTSTNNSTSRHSSSRHTSSHHSSSHHSSSRHSSSHHSSSRHSSSHHSSKRREEPHKAITGESQRGNSEAQEKQCSGNNSSNQIPSFHEKTEAAFTSARIVPETCLSVPGSISPNYQASRKDDANIFDLANSFRGILSTVDEDSILENLNGSITEDDLISEDMSGQVDEESTSPASKFASEKSEHEELVQRQVASFGESLSMLRSGMVRGEGSDASVQGLKTCTVRVKRLRSPDKYRRPSGPMHTRLQHKNLLEILEGGPPAKRIKMRSSSLETHNPHLYDAEFSDSEDLEPSTSGLSTGYSARTSDSAQDDIAACSATPTGSDSVHRPISVTAMQQHAFNLNGSKQAIIDQFLLPTKRCIDVILSEEEKEKAKLKKSWSSDDECSESDDELPDLIETCYIPAKPSRMKTVKEEPDETLGHEQKKVVDRDVGAAHSKVEVKTEPRHWKIPQLTFSLKRCGRLASAETPYRYRHFSDIISCSDSHLKSSILDSHRKLVIQKHEEEDEEEEEEDEEGEEDQRIPIKARIQDGPYVRRKVRLTASPGEACSRSGGSSSEGSAKGGPTKNAVPSGVLYNDLGQPYRNCVRTFTRDKQAWLYNRKGPGIVSFEPLQEQAKSGSRAPTVVYPFDESILNTIEAHREEIEDADNTCDIDYFANVVEAALSFTNAETEPPNDVIRMILFTVLLKARSISTVYKAYHYVLWLLQLHPPKDSLPFSWEDLEMVVRDLKLQLGIHVVEDGLSLLRNKLALHYMVESIEAEFLNRPVGKSRQVYKSQCYRWLSSDVSSCKMRSIVQWLVSSLTYGDYNFSESLSTLSVEKSQTAATVDAPNRTQKCAPVDLAPSIKVYHCIEKLLDLSIAVSRSSEKCLDDFGCELSLEYSHLYSVSRKAFLVENISNPHLRLVLVCKVLDNCDNDSFFGVRSIKTVDDVIQKYFSATPPRIPYTPPPSPDDALPGPGSGQDLSVSKCSLQGIEELVMLLYNCLFSYLLSAKGSKNKKTLDLEDRHSLQELPAQLEVLERRLVNLCPRDMQLSQTTRRYLTSLHALTHVT